MNLIKKLTVSFLLLFPIILILYKSFIIDIPLIPKKASNFFEIELNVKRTLKDAAKFEPIGRPVLPIPRTGNFQYVESILLDGKPIDESVQGEDSEDYLSIFDADGNLIYKAISIKLIPLGKSLKTTPRKPFSRVKIKDEHLSLHTFSSEEIELLEGLKDTLIFDTDSTEAKVRKFFFYLADEIALDHDLHKLSSITNFSSGSYYAQARMLVGLSRLVGAPARVVFGLKFLDPTFEKTLRYTRVLMTEVYLDGQWMQFLPEGRIDGQLDGNQVLLCRECGDYALPLLNKDLMSLVVRPIKYDPISSEEQTVLLGKVSPIIAIFSLHNLPLSLQLIVIGVILIPLGTIVISLSRVVIGIETLGIFLPLLLALFFVETSFFYGSILFVLVVLLGLTQRKLLDRFYLLAVPRLSVSLSFIIIAYLLFTLLTLKLELSPVAQRSLGYFPIVIITVFIERLSLSIQEEGVRNTMKIAVGTFFVSSLCYLLLSIEWLETFLFNNPEVILFSIGVNIMIGSYTGLRVSELKRFKNLKEKGTNVDFKLVQK